MKNDPKQFVACGMYAFTAEQQHAWRQLFDQFFARCGESADLKFEHGSLVLEKPGLWFGHTCGYPLIAYQYETLSPFCVPLFDVPGTEGPLYSSRFIVTADALIDTLEQCRGRVAAINNPDSNSGMNLLRRAVAELQSDGSYFAGVKMTGGHLNSFEAVARGLADVAAIDCVSYQLIVDWKPEVAQRVRVIGESVKTTGLPFVMPHARLAATDVDGLIASLNQALDACPDEVRSRLHLAGFEKVTLGDYQNVIDAEQFAIERGYPKLA